MHSSVRQAVYDALTVLPGAWPVYSRVPFNKELPYLCIPMNAQGEWGVKDALTSRWVTVEVHLWSAYDGFKEVEDKMEEVITALQTLTSASFSIGKAVLASTAVLEEDDAVHGIVRFDYKILEV